MNQPIPPVHSLPVTLINVFEVQPEHVEAFIAQWRQRAALMGAKPGFLDYRLHRALSPESRFQLVTVAHWENREAYEAAMADDEFQARTKGVMNNPQLPVSAYPALYEVAVEFSGPGAGRTTP
jgi:heme-degrading monooxygenase HmoA